jgi:hypothetical protein
VIGACASDVPPKISGVQEIGVDGAVGDLRVLAIHVEPPPTDRYSRDADLRVIFTIVNVGTAADAMVGASSPDAERTEIRWDRGCDGTPDVVRRLPIAPAAAADTTTATGVSPFDPYDLVLVSIRRDVLAGATIPLVLTFERAGRLDTAAYVPPSSARFAEPVRRCAPERSRTPTVSRTPTSNR